MEPAEQAPAPPPPTRRRRRRLIVGFVLVLVSMVSWWYWPRGDARFVGKWRCHRTCPSLEVSIWTLSSNGTGSVTLDDGKRQTFGWQVSDNQFDLGNGIPDWIVKSVRSLPRPLARLLGSNFQFTGGSYELINVSAEECVLRMRAPAYCVVMLRRLPE